MLRYSTSGFEAFCAILTRGAKRSLCPEIGCVLKIRIRKYLHGYTYMIGCRTHFRGSLACRNCSSWNMCPSFFTWFNQIHTVLFSRQANPQESLLKSPCCLSYSLFWRPSLEGKVGPVNNFVRDPSELRSQAVLGPISTAVGDHAGILGVVGPASIFFFWIFYF